MESAAGGQKHNLTYQEHLFGNTLVNFKSVIEKLETPDRSHFQRETDAGHLKEG